MIVPLGEAAAGTCGGKAGTLGALLRAGLPVPGGFVIPFAAYHDHVRAAGEATPEAIRARSLDAALAAALARELGDAPVAVRSSASDEDTGQASAAGQHETFLAVRDATAVEAAVRACWASLLSPRAVGYRGGRHDAAMAVIVQRHLDAEASGVMFTPAHPGDVTLIEASWGLGPSVVGGKVTPDSFRVPATGPITRTIGAKQTRLDRRGAFSATHDAPAPDRHGEHLAAHETPTSAPLAGYLVTREVSASDRYRPVIDDATATRLAALGAETAALLNGPQDIEWALAEGRLWLLQARPITAALPPDRPASGQVAEPPAVKSVPGQVTGPSVVNSASGPTARPPASSSDASATYTPAAGVAAVAFIGTPGSRGSASGIARIVRGPDDFARVRPGDILVCPYTDPAWTPLLRIAGGVVTETGGVLSHAAIVAREYAIPAVLGVPSAMSGLRDGTVITVDGTTGTVTAAP